MLLPRSHGKCFALKAIAGQKLGLLVSHVTLPDRNRCQNDDWQLVGSLRNWEKSGTPPLTLRDSNCSNPNVSFAKSRNFRLKYVIPRQVRQSPLGEYYVAESMITETLKSRGESQDEG